MHGFSPSSQGTMGPQDMAIPYAEETGTVLIGRHCGTYRLCQAELGLLV